MNYTASDILGVGAGFVLFALFAFAPGYTFGWLSDMFQFRRRRLATRIAAAVPLSIGLMPITGYFLWRCWLPLVWVVFGACGAACVVLLIPAVRKLGLHLSRAGWKVAAIAGGWLAVGTLSLVDLQFGNRLYFPVSADDLSTRAAFTAAMAREGIPPHNPFFFAGLPAPLRYHYFWLIPASLVERLGGSLVSARLSLIASILWSGLGLMGIIALYLRFFQGKGGEQIERRTLIAISLLGITGLDIIPVLLIDFGGHIVLPTIEWWNNQISAWITTMLWVPHDLAGLTAGMTGFLLAWEATREERRRQSLVGLAAAGMAFASAVGLSVYVGGTVAAGCALWLVVSLVKRWWRRALVLASAGTLAVVLLLPFIFQILYGAHPASTPGGAKTALPFALTVRAFTLPDIILHSHNPVKLMALNAVLLPLNYFLEFGFFFVVGNLWLRRIRREGFRDQAEWGAVVLSAASLVICTFVSSTIITNNDLGWRSPLVVQFMLLLWAAEMWHEGTLGFGLTNAGRSSSHPRAAPLLVTVTLVLGAMGSCYELCLQRAFPILSDLYHLQTYTWLSPDQQLGRRTFALRRAYRELDRLLPPSAVVQANPRGGMGNLQAALYSGRQMVANASNCGTVFGGSAKFCNDVILPQLKPLFDNQHPVTNEEVDKVCREFSINALLFEDIDPVWKDKSSWIWKAQPLLSNQFVRVIKCGGMACRGAGPGGCRTPSSRR